jgi:MATE family multidrug resistance protein
MASPARDRFLAQFSRLAVANVLSNLMVPLASIIDTAFLGHLADIHHLGGVAIATVIFNVVYWSFGFLRMGTTGLTAQAHGRGEREEMQLILLRNGLLALGLGLLIVSLQSPIQQLGFWLLSAPADVRISGEAFYHARIWGAPAVLLNYVLLGWFLGQGQGRRVVLLSMVANGGNIGLDYWFIRELGWASAGAGAATAISQGLMLMVGLGFVMQAAPLQELWQQRAKVWHGAALRTLFQLNRDILIRTFALVGSFALFTNWSAALGTPVLAANTLLLQVVTLASYFIDGLAFATESFAGRFYGVGDRAQLRTLLSWGLLSSLLLSLIIACMASVFPNRLFSIMTTHTAVLSVVERYVWWLWPTLGFGAIAFLLDGYFLGLTAGKRLRNSTVCAAVLGFLPIGLLAHYWANSHLLWLALASFMAVRAATLARHVPMTLIPPQSELPSTGATPITASSSNELP